MDIMRTSNYKLYYKLNYLYKNIKRKFFFYNYDLLSKLVGLNYYLYKGRINPRMIYKLGILRYIDCMLLIPQFKYILIYIHNQEKYSFYY